LATLSVDPKIDDDVAGFALFATQHGEADIVIGVELTVDTFVELREDNTSAMMS